MNFLFVVSVGKTHAQTVISEIELGVTYLSNAIQSLPSKLYAFSAISYRSVVKVGGELAERSAEN